MGTDKNTTVGDISEHGIKDGSVASILNRIHPNQDRIDTHELLVNFLTELIVVNGWLHVHPQAGQSFKYRRQTMILRPRLLSGRTIARIKQCNPSKMVICHTPCSMADFNLSRNIRTVNVLKVCELFVKDQQGVEKGLERGQDKAKFGEKPTLKCDQ